METAENKYITVAYKLYTTEDGKRDLVEEDLNESIRQQFTSSDNITEEEIVAYTEKMAEVKKLAKYKVQDEKKEGGWLGKNRTKIFFVSCHSDEKPESVFGDSVKLSKGMRKTQDKMTKFCLRFSKLEL